jgi:hypothetical protein
MAYTEADLARIDAAIASAELEVQYGEKRVRYRSVEELRAARTVILQDLQNGTGASPRIVRLRHGGKGV